MVRLLKHLTSRSTYQMRSAAVIVSLLLSCAHGEASSSSVVTTAVLDLSEDPSRELRVEERELLRPYTEVGASHVTHGDTHTHPLPFSPSFTHLIDYLTYTYWDMPRECRHDLCDSEKTIDYVKGEFQWSETEVGLRRLTRCPYAVHDFIYAHRDCLPVNNSYTDWSEPVYQHCPPPPFSVVLEQVYESYQSQILDDRNLTNASVHCAELSKSFLTLSALKQKYPTHPQLYNDTVRLTSLFSHWVLHCLTAFHDDGRYLTELELRAVLRFSDSLQASNTWGLLPLQDSLSRYFAQLVKILLSLNETVYYRYEGHDISLISSPLNLSTTSNLTLYVRDLSESDSLESSNVSEKSKATITSSSDLLKKLEAVLFTNVQNQLFSISELRSGSPTPTLHFTHRKRRTVDIQSSRHQASQSTGGIVLSDQSSARDHRELSRLMLNETDTSLDHFPDDYTLNVTTDESWSIPSNLAVVIGGPMLYLRLSELLSGHIQHDIEGGVSVQVTFTSPQFKKIESGSYCAQLSSKKLNPLTGWWTDVSEWTTEGCRLIDTDTYIVTCQCNVSMAGAGQFITVFTPLMFPIVSRSSGRKFILHNSSSEVTSFSTFMGFPYNRELFITSQVLRPLSLLCLVLTVVSHLAFRKSRKGATARILLNLCASLIGLQLALYLAEGVAHTRVGCRTANILRYYVIMASLLWNGAEAHNMYRMLVKVFSGETSWFVLQAGLVAWGLPALIIGVALIIRVNVFDGSYLECKFRCSLDRTMMIYAYLIPMILIVLHNILMFSLVLAALRKNSLGQSKAVRRTNSIRLTGAVTMLVLLGVPWVFSSFAVIDADEDTKMQALEAAFNIIFIVFINLQGIFIFSFHCARNKTIRTEMSSVISRSSTSSSYIRGNSNTRQTNSTHSDHNVKVDESTAKEKSSTSKV